MKEIITVVLSGFAFASVQAQNMPGMKMDNKKETTKKQSASYVCPMHPEVHSATPGNCPKCGMKLVKEKTPGSKSIQQADSIKTGMTDMPGTMGQPADKNDTTHTMQGRTDMPMNSMENGLMKNRGSANLTDKIAMAKVHLGPFKTIAAIAPPHTVHYDLYVADTTVTFGKKKKRAIAVNGQIPMPTLTFTEGDTAEIVVHNNLEEETALHWHGLLLPNRYDGVPNLTQMPIPPHSVFTYRFPIIQHGTHWYHSHSGLQEQIGMYGSMILNRRAT